MAKFTTYYNLCPIHDNKEFLGLSKDRDDGNIIATMGRNIIIIINLKTQKQIHSWTVLDKLSCKVVFDRNQNSYVGVFGNKYIRCWDENISDLNKVQKMKFQKNIVDLVSTDNDETVIVYEDGSCESLLSGIDGRKEKPMKFSDIQLISINDPIISELYDGRKLLTYFYKNDKMDHVELVTILLDENNFKPLQAAKAFQLTRRDQDVTLSGYTVIKGHHLPSLLTVWSDKRIFLLSLNDNLSLHDVPGNILSMMDNLNVNSSLSVIGMSNNCVAIYGANNGQEGSSLLLYNTQFKVVKAKQFFKIYFDFSNLWVIGNHILLAMGQNLCVVSYRVSQELLSDIIGSQAANEMQSYVGDDFINEEYELENVLKYIKKTAKEVNHSIMASNENNYVPNHYNRITDGKLLAFQPYSKFEEDFNSVCSHNFHLEMLSNKILDNHTKVNLLSNHNDDGEFNSHEIEIIAEELKRSGASEQEISEKLLTLLMKAECNNDIGVCLRRYTNISERILCKILKYAVSDCTIELNCNIKETALEVELNDIVVEKIETTTNEFANLNLLINIPCKIVIKEKNDLINLLLSCSVDYDLLAWHMRNEINLNHALNIIKHLYNLIITTDNCLEERIDNCYEFNEDLIILKWFGVILNTHFQKLVLCRDLELIDVLLKWHEILNTYKTHLNELEELSVVLYNLLKEKPICKENRNSKWYSIEEVSLF